MIRKNSRISAASRTREASSTVAAEPLIAASGARNSWLTMPRNSARIRSNSSSGARSCTVTTIDSAAPSAERIGVALTSSVMLRPSGTESTTSSPRTVAAPLITSFIGNSARATSRPSEKRQVSTSSNCSSGLPDVRSASAIRLASRLNDTALPVRASNTTTPTGEVSTRASRSARARFSSRCARALTIAAAACEANNASVSSSSGVNACPPSFSPRKKAPTCTPR